MQTESIYQNDILFTVPMGFKELSARKLDLDKITENDPEIMFELYTALAVEFEDIEYLMIADSCRRRAAQWAKMAK